MDATTIKGRLHEYIETADTEHLAAIYVLVQKELDAPNRYDADTIKMLYDRLEDDLKGNSRSYTVEEAFALVRQSKNK